MSISGFRAGFDQNTTQLLIIQSNQEAVEVRLLGRTVVKVQLRKAGDGVENTADGRR